MELSKAGSRRRQSGVSSCFSTHSTHFDNIHMANMAAASTSSSDAMAGAASWPPSLKAFVSQTFAAVSARHSVSGWTSELMGVIHQQCTDANRDKVEAELKKVNDFLILLFCQADSAFVGYSASSMHSRIRRCGLQTGRLCNWMREYMLIRVHLEYPKLIMPQT